MEAGAKSAGHDERESHNLINVINCFAHDTVLKGSGMKKKFLYGRFSICYKSNLLYLWGRYSSNDEKSAASRQKSYVN